MECCSDPFQHQLLGMTESNQVSKETKWIDAWIRWNKAEDDEDSAEEEERVENPFHIDASKEFSFSFAQQQHEEIIQIHLQGYNSESEEAWSSTGLTVWRSGEYLCRYLAGNPSLLKDSSLRVLECGSGLGLCGIFAHFLSKKALNIYLTDGDTEALSQLRRNIKRNCNNDTLISCHQLLWGLETAQAFRDSHGTFDLIIGSDLIYVKAVVKPLWDTINTLLTQQGVCLMAYCARHTESDRHVTLHDILEASRLVGFCNQCVETATNEDGEEIYIHRFWRIQVEERVRNVNEYLESDI